jgi:pyruvate carboxylase
MRNEKRVLITDTTMRDAHQSLLATRMRTRDIVGVAEAYSRGLPQLLSLECWGGATFDVAMRFLNEDPWERLALIRAQAPNVLTQMLLRGANGVGYTNYPDNVVRHFVQRAAEGGMDLFRIFDCLNWVDNMRVAIDAVLDTGKLAEGALCYTGDILDPSRAKYSLDYYVKMAKELEKAGCHILAIKDMAGLLKPAAARVLVKALRDEVGLPVHLHTHDTSGISAATVLAAIDAGVDAVDAAMDAMSGMTAQPCLGSIVEALRHGERDPGLDPEAIRRISFTGKPCASSTPPSRATSRRAPPRCICTRCPAASSPTSRSRPARSASTPAGTRWRAPTAAPTTCSATSSRSPRRPRWSATWP